MVAISSDKQVSANVTKVGSAGVINCISIVNGAESIEQKPLLLVIV